MLCKAGIFGDRELYQALVDLAVRGGGFPKQAKDLGSGVRNFDSEIWNAVVASVAYTVVVQKFGKLPQLGHLLIATGDSILAEAAQSDRIWGIGLSVADGRHKMLANWLGSNILGWALMEARKTLSSSK